MKLAVISCWNYRDAWTPFFALLEHYWPDHPPAYLLTDRIGNDGYHLPSNINIFNCYGVSVQWCQVLTEFLSFHNDQPVLLMQEDFFLTAKVNSKVVGVAEKLLRAQSLGAVRLYPMPGANVDSPDDYFGFVSRGTPYRISCQAAIWRPSFLSAVASKCTTPWNFETIGSPYADKKLPEDVMAYKRDVHPWPMEYLCSGISAGEWNPDSKRLCDRLGITNDWTMRKMQTV